jgi:tRNA_anti-like
MLQRKKSRILIAVMVLTFIIAAIGLGYFRYQQPRQTAANQQAELKLNAVQLFNDFIINETGATTKYTNMVITVEGEVIENGTIAGSQSLLLFTGAVGSINCSLLKTDTSISLHQIVQVKGKCTGFLGDVLMVDCVIVP